MKRVNVTPLKDVNGVRFGETRATVRREYGPYTESKGPGGSCDDFKWCKVHYDRNFKMESVELNMNECSVIVNSTNIDPRNRSTCQRGLGITSGNVDKGRGIFFSESATGKVGTIGFAKNGNSIIMEATSEEYKNESAEDDYEKELSGLVGPDEAKTQVDAEKQERDQYVSALKDAKDKRPASSILGTPKKEDGSLSQYYNDLKNQLNSNPAAASNPMIKVGPPMSMMHHHPGHHSFMHMAHKACDELKDKCCKHFIMDIYCKIHPLDDNYVAGNMGAMNSDVDNMLAAKNMTPNQYLTSCTEATGAPLLKFMMRAVDNIGQQFMEEAKEKLKDAEANSAEIAPPEVPEPEDDPEINNQLVDVKNDPEYENFIDKLKEKTIKKIVSDVSKIISDKKEENDMVFDPKPQAAEAPVAESTTAVAMQYIQESFMRAGVELSDDDREEMIGMAIRESTLNEINTCFKQPETDIRRFSTRIRMGRGYVINEKSVNAFVESASH